MSCTRPSDCCPSPKCRTTTTGTTKVTPSLRVDLHAIDAMRASLGGPVGCALQVDSSLHHGRSNGYAECAATRDDNYRIERKLKPSFRAKGMGWDHPLITPQPLLAYFLLTVHCATQGHF